MRLTGNQPPVTASRCKALELVSPDGWYKSGNVSGEHETSQVSWVGSTRELWPLRLLCSAAQRTPLSRWGKARVENPSKGRWCEHALNAFLMTGLPSIKATGAQPCAKQVPQLQQSKSVRQRAGKYEELSYPRMETSCTSIIEDGVSIGNVSSG